MATLVLTVAAQYLGAAPLTLAAVSMAGAFIDRAIFKPVGPAAPDPEQARVTSSAYGVGITKWWGTERLAGNLIWCKRELNQGEQDEEGYSDY